MVVGDQKSEERSQKMSREQSDGEDSVVGTGLWMQPRRLRWSCACLLRTGLDTVEGYTDLS